MGTMNLFSRGKSTQKLHQFLTYGTRRKLVCLALILSLLILPLPSNAFTKLFSFPSSAINYVNPVKALTALSNWLLESKSKSIQADTLADRQARVTKVSVTPFKLVGYQGQTINFSALVMDSSDRVIQGVKLTWESLDSQKVQIDDSGQATFIQPGLATITCRAGSASGTATILIRPGNRPEQSDIEWRADQGALSHIPTTSTTSTGTSGAINLIPSILDKLMPTAQAQSTGDFLAMIIPLMSFGVSRAIW
jgi:hypothetical protein